MKKIKMRRYSFSSNKSQLIVSRITALNQSCYQLCRQGRVGLGMLIVLQLGSGGDAAGKISVRYKEELPGWGWGLEPRKGM